MKRFQECVQEGKVKRGAPSPSESDSLKQQACDRLKDLLTLPLDENNASFRFESAYEVIRELLQSFLAKEGYKPYSHDAIFAFALEQKILAKEKVITADRYREIRNDINYRGKKVTAAEAKEIITFAKEVVELRSKK